MCACIDIDIDIYIHTHHTHIHILHIGNKNVFQVYECVSSLCFAVWKNKHVRTWQPSLSPYFLAGACPLQLTPKHTKASQTGQSYPTL